MIGQLMRLGRTVTTWSSRSRTVEHPASRPISKATAHTKACAALRKGRHGAGHQRVRG